ncbi:MAG: histidine kinase [Bacteroidales bacterium]|nr:histidine kinase [Bacteroidales bacterium]
MDPQQYSITRNLAKQFNLPRWTLHVIYWIFWVNFWAIMWGTYDNNFEKTYYIQILELPFKLALVYPVIHFLMPKYLLKGRYFTFILVYLVWLFITGILVKIVWYLFIEPIYFQERLIYSLLKFTELMNVVLTMNTTVVVPFVIKLIDFWLYHQQKSATLEYEKMQAELKFLRTQVNPHFLFNALNSVYALSLQKSELTSDSISRLSEIMRYIIYEASAPRVSLKKEINFINNYIAFEKIRFAGEMDVSVYIKDERKSDIPPLLFLVPIENAFKHLRSFSGEKPWVTIQFEADDQQIKLIVENSIDTSIEIAKNRGIGIENLKKRLELIYPEKHKLTFEQSEFSYKASLVIKESL